MKKEIAFHWLRRLARERWVAASVVLFAAALVIVLGAVFISRFFCRLLCPLGAFYSLFNRNSLVKLDFIEGNCVHCLACVPACPTGVRPYEERDSRDCILCLKCVDACRFGALNVGLRRQEPAPRKHVVVEPPGRAARSG